MDLTVKRKRIESLLESDPINRSKLTTVGKYFFVYVKNDFEKKKEEIIFILHYVVLL
jgi:predicted transcriptional regulator